MSQLSEIPTLQGTQEEEYLHDLAAIRQQTKQTPLSRDTTLLTKVHIVTAMVFPVVMYGCESWTIKKAKCQRIDAFELWCWRRLLRVP